MPVPVKKKEKNKATLARAGAINLPFEQAAPGKSLVSLPVALSRPCDLHEDLNLTVRANERRLAIH